MVVCDVDSGVLVEVLLHVDDIVALIGEVSRYPMCVIDFVTCDVIAIEDGR